MRHLIDFGDLPREEWDSLYRHLTAMGFKKEKLLE